MIATVQRVSHARVSVDNIVSGEIENGFLILLGVFEDDTFSDADVLAKKTANLRVFCDSEDKMNLSLLDMGYGALAVSNFTLCADTKKGNRPSFINAKKPDEAEELYEYFAKRLTDEGVKTVEKGVFGGDMRIEAELDGPITINLDSRLWRK